MTLRLYRTAVVAALVVLTAFAPARGQQRDLPVNIVGSGSLTQPQRDQINAFAGEMLTLLRSADPSDTKRGRQGLLGPLEVAQATVAFRTQYSQVLVPELEKLITSPGGSEIHAINALVVAGPLATKQSADLAVKSMADQRLAVRYAAVAALRETFESLEVKSPAIVPANAGALVDTLAAALLTETDAQVFDVLVRALAAAAGMQRPNFEEVSTRGLRALAERGSERLQKLSTKPEGDAFVESLVRAAGVLRDAVANNRVNAELAKKIAEFGGHLWAWVYRGISGGDNPPPQGAAAPAITARRMIASAAVLAAQNAMFFGAQRIQPGMEDPFRGGDVAKWVSEATPASDERFLRRTREIFGAGGFMTSPPLNFSQNLFIK